MSASFHPAEEGNFAPLRQNAEEMFKAAKKWKEAEVPATYKPKETKEALKELLIKCGALHKAVVANKPDQELKVMITEAHDVFHKIVGECRNAD